MSLIIAPFRLSTAETRAYHDIKNHDSVEALKYFLSHAGPKIGPYVWYLIGPIIGPNCISWVLQTGNHSPLLRTKPGSRCIASFMKPDAFRILWRHLTNNNKPKMNSVKYDIGKLVGTQCRRETENARRQIIKTILGV